MRVLIADDDRISAAMVARMVERWSARTDVVNDGDAAWNWLKAVTEPTLAVLDWMMPGLDGPTICRRVRSELPMANVYLLLVTARDAHGDLIVGLDAGADDYVRKPFEAEELRARVASGVRVLTLQEKLAERVSELEAALAKVKQLSGLLPICSYCKRIRGDDQYWQQVDGYITQHSDAKFSHGICPACFAALNAELDLKTVRRD